MVQIPDHLMERMLTNLLSENEQLKGAMEEVLNKHQAYKDELLKAKGELSNYTNNSPKVIPNDLVELFCIMAGECEGSPKISGIKWARAKFPQLGLLEAKQLTERLMDNFEVRRPGR